MKSPSVQKVGNAIHWIMQYMGVPSNYPLESDLFGGWHYPSFKQPVPEKDTEAVTSFNNTMDIQRHQKV